MPLLLLARSGFFPTVKNTLDRLVHRVVALAIAAALFDPPSEPVILMYNEDPFLLLSCHMLWKPTETSL